MPSPIWNGCVSLPYTPSSCCQITRSTGVAPRPPYSFGQCRQTQPPSDFFLCQAFATSTMSCFCNLIRPREAFESSDANSFGALASIHAFASARNAASCGVSSKFMANLSRLEPRVSPHGEEALAPSRTMSRPSFETPRFARLLRMRSSSSPSLGRDLVERYVLVDPDVAGQPQHALGDDVAHDLVGAAFDAGAGRAQQHRLEFAGGLCV